MKGVATDYQKFWEAFLAPVATQAQVDYLCLHCDKQINVLLLSPFLPSCYNLLGALTTRQAALYIYCEQRNIP